MFKVFSTDGGLIQLILAKNILARFTICLFLPIHFIDTNPVFRLRFKRPTFDQKFLFICIRFDLISVELVLNFEKRNGQKKLSSGIMYIY